MPWQPFTLVLEVQTGLVRRDGQPRRPNVNGSLSLAMQMVT